MSKFLEFKKDGNDIHVINKKHKTKLGVIRYYPLWKEAVFIPRPNAVFSSGCLADINHILRLNK